MACDLAWFLVYFAAAWPLLIFVPWLLDWYRKRKDPRSRFRFVFYVCYSAAILLAILLHYNVLAPSDRVGSGRAFHGFGVRATWPLVTLERWLLVGLLFSVIGCLRAKQKPSIFACSWASGGRHF